MNERFFEACYYKQHKILGHTLAPYSLSHVVALHAIKSPFIEKDSEIEPDALLIALKICETPRPLVMPTFSLTLGDRIAAWRMKRDQKFFIEQCLRFTAYVDDHCACPEFWEDAERSDKKLSAPWTLSRVAQLLTKTTLSHSEAWSLPLGYAFWLAGSISELEGSGIRFFDESQIEGVKK